MKIEADSPADYWAKLPDDWRRTKMAALRGIIQTSAPGAAEDLGYGMLRYAWDADRVLCHMNCQMRYVGLYLGDVAALDPSGALNDGLDVGKGCVRVRKRDDLDQIKDLIQRKATLRLG